MTLPQAAMLHALARTVSRRTQKRYVREVTGRADAKVLNAALAATLREFGQAAIDNEIENSLVSVWVLNDGATLGDMITTPVGTPAPARAKLVAAAIHVTDWPAFRDSLLHRYRAVGLPTDPAVRGAVKRINHQSRPAPGEAPGYDEWIVGEGLEPPGRWYVIHAHYPPFLAECDDDERWSLTQFGGLVFTIEERAEWLYRAIQVMDDYDVRVDRRAIRERMAEDDEQLDDCLEDA